MVKLQRDPKPEIWTDARVQKWTELWEKKLAKEREERNAGVKPKEAQWRWNQANGEPINRTATASLEDWHFSKCAYCEARMAGNLEIEHFYPKRDYPKQAYEWENLFLSCGSCNRAKGNDAPDISLKVDIDDPKDYLWFSPALNQIVPKYGISTHAKKRAEKTIELYELDRDDLKYNYKLHWREITLQSNPINLARLSTNNSGPHWGMIAKYIQNNYPAIEARAKSTEQFSLMVRSIINEYIPATKEK